MFNGLPPLRENSRRDFLRAAGLLGIGSFLLGVEAAEERTITLPFENGIRPLVPYPQKRPLIRHTTRPPQLETPFAVFNEGILTPNDAFFVRYHLTLSPPPMELLEPEKFRVVVQGKVRQPLSLALGDLKSQFEAAEIVAVNQCSGNGRGFFKPRVPGGQLGNGAMGNARWRGVRLKDVLSKAGVREGARHVLFNGLDKPLVAKTPDFIKALAVDHALDGEVLLAYEMNGQPLPWLNGYPLRLVVPGFYGTYWVKHVHEITVTDIGDENYWMNTAYRIPDNACGCVEPGSLPAKTTPITRLNVRSFITSPETGTPLRAGAETTVRGIAFDGGHGITEVLFSDDGGRAWRRAELGTDGGKYSFREWKLRWTPPRAGAYELKTKATNRIGQSQPLEPLWNPAGYMRNVVESLQLTAI
ncbi:MAG: sulfite dehydrogenase (cytochrome) subunit [Verrucomicrobiota bacterium]|jgi:DMSO/TMAO reductase YedYZ molybdopterin-dependent catalytic subunit